MKRGIVLLVMAMTCVCCLGLAACGGSASSSAASSASASSSSSKASVSSAASDEVSPELKAFVEEYVGVCDKLVAVVDKAKEAGSYNAVEDEWKAVSDELNGLNDEAQQWAKKYNDGELSDADKSYYNKKLVPAATKSASAGLEMLDLIEI